MKILTVCEQGNNRSVTAAQRLKYCRGGQDVLAIGLERNSPETVAMLCEWADRIVTTEVGQAELLPAGHEDKVICLNVGPDKYPRPFNRDLLKLTDAAISANYEAIFGGARAEARERRCDNPACSFAHHSGPCRWDQSLGSKGIRGPVGTP